MAVLAFDIGASSGRAVVGMLESEKIRFIEVHRFKNEPVTVSGRMYWDILSLFREIKVGISIATREFDIEKIGIDTWGVDFGIIGKDGRLLENPRHYRDMRNNDVLCNRAAYDISGIQFMGFNTMYQLMKTDMLCVDKVLLIPDLLCYFLTGQMRTEYTNASTTNLLDARTHEFAEKLLEYADISREMFPKMIKPGEVYGTLTDEIACECGCKNIPVIAVGTHDTASAVAAVPYENGESFAYISSGTWSLFGTSLKEPVISEESFEHNFTNELGVDFSIRFLKNITGMWLLQELAKDSGESFDTLTEMAMREKPFAYFIDPDSQCFSQPGNMSKKIMTALGSDSLTLGELVRCVYDSLAMKYRYTLEELELVTARKYDRLYIVGGGVKNKLLCDMTAHACGIPVFAGEAEATALGNLSILLYDSIENARAAIRASSRIDVYMPTDKAAWDNEYNRFREVIKA